MAGSTIEFYADHDDLRLLLDGFHSLGDFVYIAKTGRVNEELFQTREPLDLWFRLEEVGKGGYREQFFAVDKDSEIMVRDIRMTDGSGIKKSVNQYTNPNSVELRLSGDIGNDTLVMSEICTLGDTERSREMHKAFKKLVLRHTTRLGGKGTPYRLMSGAIDKLKDGWRLARGIGLPESMDPRISPEEIASL